VRVAVVDTGVDTSHPDLRDRIVKTAPFVQGGERTFVEDNHGTAVTGIIAADADNGIGIFGVAPERRSW
jgi:subtilisin family serine protease